jgi:O-antigen ligase
VIGILHALVLATNHAHWEECAVYIGGGIVGLILLILLILWLTGNL